MAIGSSLPSPKLPRLAITAGSVAFLLAISGVLSALHNVVVILPALVPAVAGVTIFRRHTWGAYGFALYEFAAATIIPGALLRDSMAPKGQIAFLSGFSLGIAILFFFAGKSLAATGASAARCPPGSPSPACSPCLFFSFAPL